MSLECILGLLGALIQTFAKQIRISIRMNFDEKRRLFLVGFSNTVMAILAMWTLKREFLPGMIKYFRSDNSRFCASDFLLI